MTVTMSETKTQKQRRPRKQTKKFEMYKRDPSGIKTGIGRRTEGG